MIYIKKIKEYLFFITTWNGFKSLKSFWLDRISLKPGMIIKKSNYFFELSNKFLIPTLRDCNFSAFVRTPIGVLNTLDFVDLNINWF